MAELSACRCLKLLGLLHGGAPAAGMRWIERALAHQGWDRDAMLAAHAGATRHLGISPIVIAPAALETLGLAPYQSRWWCDEMGRAVILLDAAGRAPACELPDVVEDAYRHGDVRERQAVLRALPLLPEPARFVDLAIHACRTNILPVFEAIACESPYPAACFPTHAFDQMVLKALFLGVALARIVGLAQRRGPELERMAADYASERRAAGRSVPQDIERYITGPNRKPGSIS